MKAAISSDATTEDRSSEIAQRVSNLIVAAQTASQSSSVITTLQKQAVDQLEARTASRVDIKLHPQTGVVRQLKADLLHRAEATDEATAQSFMRANRELLKIKAPDEEFRLTSSQTDGEGRRHLRFDQEFRGVPVWPAQALVHLDAAGNVELVNGVYVPTPESEPEPQIEADKAVGLARSAARGGDSATLRQVELIYYATDAGVAKLGWKIELAVSTDTVWLVVIDASNGGTLASYNKVNTGAATGSGVDLLNVTRTLHLYQDGNTYYTVDTSKKMYDPTSTPPSASKTRGRIIVYDTKHTPAGSPPKGQATRYFNTSTALTSGWLPDSVSAAWGLSEVYDYYLERHGRNSLDGKGGTILGLVRYGNTYFNAFWDGEAMYFGDGEPYARALDLVGHEMTHGVISSTANLEYVNQSGALNESLADIFGEAVEARTKGANDWILGAELITPFRSLKDPHSIQNTCSPTPRPYPNKMSEYLAADSAGLSGCKDSDHGGVHINSSIVNHAFYQLAAGLPNAIGIRDAERIFYDAMTLQLAPKSQFIDARLAAIVSAEKLFGKGSAQALRTAQAFDAVEIFDTSATPQPAPIPVVSGEDSVVFLFKDSKGWQLGRRETALGDSAAGNYVLANQRPVAYEKVSVSGDGSLMAFISADHDFCVMNTNASAASCTGQPNTFSSAALSPSARTVAVVLLNSAGDPDNKIRLIDISTSVSRTITLQAAATEAGATDTVLFADQMVFDFAKSRLFYDAVTEIADADGTKARVWALYALDLATNSTLSVIKPLKDLNVANPALGHVRNNLVTFDAYDPVTRNSVIYVLDTSKNVLKAVTQTGGGFGFPSFNGDDSAIVFSHFNSAVPSFSSLWRQPLAADHMTPAGTAASWLTDGDVATAYRRGAYVSGTTVVEYYHAGLDNYFITADPGEQSFVDSGGAGAFKRTGFTFKAGGPAPVCRFYGSALGPNSHFYTADEGECSTLAAAYNPNVKSWKLESYDFATGRPVNGACPAGQAPVYRAYNNGFAKGVDSNHRITSNLAAYQQNLARGWSGEGITMCAPQ